MSKISRAVIDALWPSGSAWNPKCGGDIDSLLDGIADYFDEILTHIREIKNFRDPKTTTILDDLEYDLGYIKRLDLSDQARRDLLDAFEKLVSDGTQPNLESVFGVQVHENDPASDPSLFITPEKLLVGTVSYTERNKWLAVAGRMVAGNQNAVAGRYDTTTQTPELPIIPPQGQGESDVSNLAAHWKFDGDGTDSSGNGHDGIVTGATWDPNGQIDGAISLNGSSDYVEAPYSASLNTGIFSFSVWAKVTGGTGTYRSVITSRGNNQGYILYATASNQWGFWLGTGAYFLHLDGPAVVLNTWAHITGTYDGTTMRMYVNGVEFGTGTNPSGYEPNPSFPIRIGAGNTEGNPDFFFPGLIDDVRIYDKALMPIEVIAVMNNTQVSLMAMPRFTVLGYNDNRLQQSDGLSGWNKNCIPYGSTTPPPGSVSAIRWRTTGPPITISYPVVLEAGKKYNLKTRLYNNYFGTSSLYVRIYNAATFEDIANNNTIMTGPTINNQIASVGEVSYNNLNAVWREISSTTIEAPTSELYVVQITKTDGTQGVYYAGQSLTEGDLPYQYTQALDGSFTNIRLNRSELKSDESYDALFVGSGNNYLGTGISGRNYVRVTGDATVEGFVPKDVEISGPSVINTSWYKMFYIGGDAERDPEGFITQIDSVNINKQQRATFEFLIYLLKPYHSWAGLVVNYI